MIIFYIILPQILYNFATDDIYNIYILFYISKDLKMEEDCYNYLNHYFKNHVNPAVIQHLMKFHLSKHIYDPCVSIQDVL